jgi:hypothetical protein
MLICEIPLANGRTTAGWVCRPFTRSDLKYARSEFGFCGNGFPRQSASSEMPLPSQVRIPSSYRLVAKRRK